MNIEKAIDELSSKKEKYESMVNAINIAIQALEKQQEIKDKLEKLKAMNKNDIMIIRDVTDVIEEFAVEVIND